MQHQHQPVDDDRALEREADAMGAKAFTGGRDIQLPPPREARPELLGHELAHVVQQREGRVSPTRQT